jgi:hypothetical protein
MIRKMLVLCVMAILALAGGCAMNSRSQKPISGNSRLPPCLTQ